MTPTGQILDGKATSKKVLEILQQDIEQLAGDSKPHLAAVLVGNDPASEIYVGRKMKTAEEVGVVSELHRFPESVSEEDLLAHLHQLNVDPQINAILVQLPLPKQIRAEKVLTTIALEKDVDGFHPENLGRLVSGMEPIALPCTPAGIMQLLDAYDIPLAGKRAAVVGRSNIVGKPIAIMLTQRDATVTVCHRQTTDLNAILAQSDIVIAAAGQAGLIRAEHIKLGATVVDVGTNRLPSGKVVGDVDFEAIRERAGYISPVPGGVGPMTIAMLLVNTFRLFKYQQQGHVSYKPAISVS